MIRKVALFASLSILASCATRSLPAEPAPLRPDPRICAPVTAVPDQPAGATIVQPVTVEERTATAAFLSWVASVVDVARENTGRAELARSRC